MISKDAQVPQAQGLPDLPSMPQNKGVHVGEVRGQRTWGPPPTSPQEQRGDAAKGTEAHRERWY